MGAGTIIGGLLWRLLQLKGNIRTSSISNAGRSVRPPSFGTGDMEHGIAFPELARELSPLLLRYLQRCVGDEAVAEDLLQEALIRIARGLPGFSGRARVKTWAFSLPPGPPPPHF
jgi:hypothetical protein